jgi:hypothetical protein
MYAYPVGVLGSRNPLRRSSLMLLYEWQGCQPLGGSCGFTALSPSYLVCRRLHAILLLLVTSHCQHHPLHLLYWMPAMNAQGNGGKQ